MQVQNLVLPRFIFDNRVKRSDCCCTIKIDWCCPCMSTKNSWKMVVVNTGTEDKSTEKLLPPICRCVVPNINCKTHGDLLHGVCFQRSTGIKHKGCLSGAIVNYRFGTNYANNALIHGVEDEITLFLAELKPVSD